jgi:hypothetical protein
VVVAVRHAPRTDGSPIRPAGASWHVAYEIAVVVAFAAYVAAVVGFRRASARLGVVLALAAAIQLAPLAAPLLLSKDVYTYWDRGRIEAVHHDNLYATRPSDLPTDVAYRYVAADWRHQRWFYGPTFGAVATADAAVAGSSRRTAVDLYRVLAAVSMVGLTLIVSALSTHRAFAAAFVGWNPLLALHFAGGGHNDATMMALVLGGALLLRAGRTVIGTAVWTAGIAIKWILAAFLPLEWAARRRLPSIKQAAAGFVVLAAISFAVWHIDWLRSITGLRNRENLVSSTSVAWWLSQHVGGSAIRWAHVVVAVFLALYLVLLVHAWRRRRARVGLAAGLLVAATSFLGPWYAVWSVSLSAVEEDVAAWWLSVGLTAWLLRDAVGW